MKRKTICILFLTILAGPQANPQAPAAASAARIESVQESALEPGTEVRIEGSGFGSRTDQKSVWIGGKEASIRSWGDHSIVALVPVEASSPEAIIFDGSNTLAKTTVNLGPARLPAPEYNGILVSGIKIYDDQALQQALNATRAQLAALQSQTINGSAINAQVGSLQGSTLSQSAFAVNLGNAPTPGVQTTANTGNTSTTAGLNTGYQLNSGNAVTTTSSGTNNQVTTGGNTSNNLVTSTVTNPGTQNTVGSTTSTQGQNTATVNNQLQVTGPSTQLTGTGTSQTQVTGPSTQVVTTQAPVNPVAPVLTPSSLSLPSSYSPGASNILNEQLELTYEITGYELLLEGALSDHYLRYSESGSPSQAVRPRATIGIPITIAPFSRQYQDAVAEIEVLVTVDSPLGDSPEPPLVTAILPRDKTYNVANITDKSVSIGGAVATQVISLGASALWGHKSYFVVQDQDTVALQFQSKPRDPKTSTRFGWQIRPVLGQKVVTTGMRNCFVQLAFPEGPEVASYGTVKITTRWKKYDRKRGIVLDEVIGPEVSSGDQGFRIDRFKLNPLVGAAGFDDNGDGSVTVYAKGIYLAGTFAKVGPLAFVPGTNGTTQDPSEIRFALPANQLATHNAYLVDRSGDATEIVDSHGQRLNEHECLEVSNPQAAPAGAGMTKLTVDVALAQNARCGQAGAGNTFIPYAKTNELIAVVGNQVFGLRNAPFLYTTEKSLSFLVPTGLLQIYRHVTVKRLLWGRAFESGTDLSEERFRTTPVIGQATVVSQTKDAIKIALTGTGLKGLKELLPATACLYPQEDSGAILTAPMADLKDLNQMVLTDKAGELFLVNLPADPSPPAPRIDPVTKGQPAITIPAGGQDLESLVHVKYEGKNLGIDIASNRKSVTIAASAVTKTSGTKILVFEFSGEKKVQYSITVVDQKIDTLRPPAAQPAK